MKTKCVVLMLTLSFVGIPVVQAQQATNSSPTQSATPAQPPPLVLKKEPVPSPDKYPLAEAVRVLESGDAQGNGAAKHAPTVPALTVGAANPPVSPEVPRSFEANPAVALNPPALEPSLLSPESAESRNAPATGKDA